jgi:hypothetical protein
VLIAKDLIKAIEQDTQPLGNVNTARTALEMALAPFESHRLNAPVTFPLKTRVNALTLL